ncbi:MAG: hypothetical protein IKJ31_05790 [Bacteroidaceae bacterium]|nr:hypothetical protein [Bacteroidaceae bacterium]
MNQNFTNHGQEEVNAVQAPSNEIPQQSSVQQFPENPYEDFETELQEIFGEGFKLEDESSQELLLRHLRINREQNDKLADALEQDPRLAQMLSDVVEGKRNAHASMARYFGRSLMDVDENSPEYEEMMIADEERREEVFRLAENRREYEANLEISRPIIETFCRDRGYDPSDFMEMVWEKVVFPILSGKYSYEVCTALDHSLTYEQDVEDAFTAGNVKGRNTNIQRMKEDIGDGLPKGLNSVAPETAPVKRRTNSLIEAALKA